MRSAAHAEHRAVHSRHHQYGRHAAAPPGKLKPLAFWATLHRLAGCAVGAVLGWRNLKAFSLAVGLAFVFGYALTIVPLLRGAMAWRSAAWVALAADIASITIMKSGVEPQAVSTRAVQESDAIASTNASSTRPAEVSETHPAFVELHPVAHRGRTNQQQHATEVSEIKEMRLTFQTWEV